MTYCAARANVMHETEVDAQAAHLAMNVEGTQSVAEQAAEPGVVEFDWGDGDTY